MTELELIKFQLNMANNTINHLENTREIVLNKINELQKQNKICGFSRNKSPRGKQNVVENIGIIEYNQK